MLQPINWVPGATWAAESESVLSFDLDGLQFQLLSETESENARLVQLSDVLKEEIRTYQRSEERKKHIENLEYVKNIILKVGRESTIAV